MGNKWMVGLSTEIEKEGRTDLGSRFEWRWRKIGSILKIINSRCPVVHQVYGTEGRELGEKEI